MKVQTLVSRPSKLSQCPSNVSMSVCENVYLPSRSRSEKVKIGNTEEIRGSSSVIYLYKARPL